MIVLYLPSVFVIETFGLNRSITLSSALTTVGLWFSYLEMESVGLVFINCGTPFVINCTTKVGGAWFGPRGRNFITSLLLSCVYGSIALNEFQDYSQSIDTIATISSCLVPLTLLMMRAYPEFSPTLGEEEKLNDRNNHKFNLGNQISDLMKDKGYLYIVLASAMILVANEEIHQLLSIVFF